MNKSIIKITAAIFVVLAVVASAFGSGKPRPVPAGSVSVASDPSGAVIRLDGIVRGNAPITISDISTGKHLIEVSAPDYASTYCTVLVKDGITSPLDISLEKLRGIALITSDPQGATVTRNGMNVGSTPLLMPDLEFGKYSIGLSLGGFQPKTYELSIDSPDPRHINAVLSCSTAALSLTSDPSGAAVLLNGVSRGKTPCRIPKIAEGSAILTISLDGYKEFQKQISLSAGDDLPMNVTLIPILGQITVVTVPADARIYCDNQFVGLSPAVISNLSAGDHRLRAEINGYDTMARSVKLALAESKTEEFRLTPNSGSITIVTSPADVEISLDGKLAGKTSASATNSTDQISEPLTLNAIRQGSHDILFFKKGYREVRKNVTVERDKQLTLDTVFLDRLFIPDYEVSTRTKVYRGMFVSRNHEFVRIETSPGIITSLNVSDVVRARLIRSENIKEEEKNGGNHKTDEEH